jgi:hypothetical protein
MAQNNCSWLRRAARRSLRGRTPGAMSSVGSAPGSRVQFNSGVCFPAWLRIYLLRRVRASPSGRSPAPDRRCPRGLSRRVRRPGSSSCRHSSGGSRRLRLRDAALRTVIRDVGARVGFGSDADLGTCPRRNANLNGNGAQGDGPSSPPIQAKPTGCEETRSQQR